MRNRSLKFQETLNNCTLNISIRRTGNAWYISNTEIKKADNWLTIDYLGKPDKPQSDSSSIFWLQDFAFTTRCCLFSNRCFTQSVILPL